MTPPLCRTKLLHILLVSYSQLCFYSRFVDMYSTFLLLVRWRWKKRFRRCYFFPRPVRRVPRWLFPKFWVEDDNLYEPYFFYYDFSIGPPLWFDPQAKLPLILIKNLCMSIQQLLETPHLPLEVGVLAHQLVVSSIDNFSTYIFSSYITTPFNSPLFIF